MTTVAQTRWRHLAPARAALSFVNWLDADTYPPCRVCVAHELLASETGGLHDDRSRMARRDYREGR